jgi:hypothetical protein
MIGFDDNPTHTNDIKFEEISTKEMFTRKIQIEVFCTLQFIATHSWPDCPFETESYLRDTHRHVFHIKAFKQVTHNDRDVEFIGLKNQIIYYLLDKYPTGEFGAKSCEMLAIELISEFNLSRCSVDEDGENGAVVTAI